MVDLPEQIQVVHQVASEYWDRDLNEIRDPLAAITVIKRNGGKIMGILPAFESHPEVFYKVYFYDRGFNFESAGLTVANAMPQVEGVTVPKIIAIYPEYRAILTEKEDWEGNRSGLQRFFVVSLGIDWFKVGRWLRTFHDTQVSYKKNEYFLQKKFEKIESHLQDLQSLFNDEQMKKMRRIIKEARDYFENEQLEWVISHGDFGLSNIQKKEDCLEIIDFEDCQMAPREFDILNCLVRLEYANQLPHLPKTYQNIQEQFLGGYELQIDFNNSVFEFVYLLIKLDALETYFRRRQINNYKLFLRLVLYFFEINSLKSLSAWLTNR
jgi:hypothetical protein